MSASADDPSESARETVDDPGESARETVEDPDGGVPEWVDDARERLRERFDDDLLVPALVAIAALALVLRIATLGERVAHFDEGRVAYWALYYRETGDFAYRYIVHGPLLQHLDRWVFAVMEPTDFSMRLPVAVVGGLLPLSAYLFREHLKRSEMVAMALFLAINPVMLYYSRFMRSDVLVAAFMFVAFGLLVRYYDTRDHRYVYAAVAFAALGFASKENAIVYVLTWVGATVVLVVQVALLRRVGTRSYDYVGRAIDDAGRRWREERPRIVESVIDYFYHWVMAGLLFVILIVSLYAPRGGGLVSIRSTTSGIPAFWDALLNPLGIPDFVNGVIGRITDGYWEWFGKGGVEDDGGFQFDRETYMGNAELFWDVMIQKAGALFAFAVVGFLYEWSRLHEVRRFLQSLVRPDLDRVEAANGGTAVVTRPRTLVLFASYCGFASIVGYPQGMDIAAGWPVVHALVPLSIPAGVALGRVAEWGVTSSAGRDDDVGYVVAAGVVLLVVGFAAATASTAVYANHQTHENNLVQYAQPTTDMHPDVRAMGAIADDNDDGPDAVVYWGDDFSRGSPLVKESPERRQNPNLDMRPHCLNLGHAMPLHWYFYKDDVDVTCEVNRTDLDAALASDPPPIVVTQDEDTTVPEEALSAAYESRRHNLRTSSNPNFHRWVTIWYHDDYAAQRP